MPAAQTIVDAVLAWYPDHARDLPWREAGTTPWQVLVSEVMLQQTPVARVIEPYRAWIGRWPTPTTLAAEDSSAAVAAWGRLGYPRRAVRLHAAASQVTTRHGGELPAELDQLRRLPGVGEYTAAAVYSFGFHGRAVVLDTNIRRLLGRLDAGIASPTDHIVAAERARAIQYLPEDPRTASRWSVAVMELGALVCTAASPRCSVCPVAGQCTWRMAGYPPGPKPRRPGFQGSDRQCRGQLLEVIRHRGETPVQVVLASWADADQAVRSLQGLANDGLVHLSTDGQRVRL